MGDTVSREVMSNFVHNNNNIAYNQSETAYDFKNYFREQASLHDINLSNETNNKTFNEIIEPYISDFKIRKRAEQEAKKKNDQQLIIINNLKAQLDIDHRKNEENSRLIKELRQEKINSQIENERREEEYLKSIKLLQKQNGKIEYEGRKREENQLQIINELKYQQELMNEENKKKNRSQQKIIDELNLQREKMEKENLRREENNMKIIQELKNQQQLTQQENKRREENNMKVIQELKNQQRINEQENKRREENHLKVIQELKTQQILNEEENKKREMNHQKIIDKLNSQREKMEEENLRREEGHLKVIEELKNQQKINEQENKRREENQNKIINELNMQREKIEKENKIREQNQLNTIIQLQTQREKSEKENQEQIRNMQNKFNSQIQELIHKNNDNINAINDKYQRMIMEAKKKAEEEKKLLEEKYKIEQNEHKKEVNKEFDEKVDIEIDIEIKKLEEKFKKQKEQFCMDKIKNFKLDSLKSIIISLFTKEDIGNMLIQNIKDQLVKLLDQPNRKVNHLNILVIGKTGAGKSSLIGEMLRYEKENNNTDINNNENNSSSNPKPGFFKPTTIGKPKYYESKTVPFLRFADTQGIEISSKKSHEPYGIDEVERDVTEFIIQQNESGNPDLYVHCIWYCFQPHDARIQDDEEELLINLSKNYSMETLPIILVGTKANSQQLVNEFKENFEKIQLPFKFDFIPTLAQKMDLIEPYGLDVLQKQSIIKSMSAVQSKCYQGILQDVKAMCLNNLKIKSKEIAKKIEKYKEDCLKSVSEGLNINVLKTQMIDIFITILNDFNKIILDENKIEKNKELKKESLEYLGKFIDDYFKNCLEGYIDSLKCFIDDNTNDIVNNILDFQNIFNNSHENLVYSKTKNNWTNIIQKRILDQLIKKAEAYSNMNSFTFLINLLAQGFAEAYFGSYQKIINSKDEKSKEIDKLIQEKIKSQFIDIENKIDDYLKRMKEQEEERKRKEEEERKRKEEEEKRKKEEEEKQKKEAEENKIFGKGFENGVMFGGINLFNS